MSLPPVPPPEGEVPAAPAPERLGVFGTPSAMTHWGIHLARIILDATRGGHGMRHGSYLAEFTGTAGPEAVLLCTSDCPELLLCRSLIAAAAPLVVIAEEPADVIDDLVAVSGVDHVNALRLAARSLCALQPAIAAAGATLFGRAQLDAPLSGFIDDLLRALRIAPTSAQRAEIDRHLAVPGGSVRDDLGRLFPAFVARRRELAALEAPATEAPATEGPAMEAPSELLAGAAPSGDVAAIKAVGQSYEGLATGLALETMTWPPRIFSSGDSIGAFLAGPCEMIGRARILIYGPYMHLPLGDWSARIEMEVADNLSGNRLKVDLVVGPNLLVSASAEMPALGQYAFALDFAIAEPLEPVELRFQIESGAIEGRFLLRQVVLTRRPLLAAAA